MPRLALAASDLATYAIAAGPARLPEARREIGRAATAYRAAHERAPESLPLVYGLARCLHAMARISLHSGPDADVQALLEEAAGLLEGVPSTATHGSVRLVLEISCTAADWAGAVLDHPDPAVPDAALAFSRQFTSHFMLHLIGSERDELLIQRGRVFFYGSRLACRTRGRQAGVRPIADAIRLLRPLQLSHPDRPSLALLMASMLHHARSLADFPGIRWGDRRARHLDLLLEQLRERVDELTPEQRRELESLQ